MNINIFSASASQKEEEVKKAKAIEAAQKEVSGKAAELLGAPNADKTQISTLLNDLANAKELSEITEIQDKLQTLSGKPEQMIPSKAAEALPELSFFNDDFLKALGKYHTPSAA